MAAAAGARRMTTAGPRQGGTQGNPAHQHMEKFLERVDGPGEPWKEEQICIFVSICEICEICEVC